VTSPLPLASLCSLVGSLLNNGNAVYDMGPATTIMERKIISWMSELIGHVETGDGFFTSGGTLGNLTALLAARQAKTGYDIWTEGAKDSENLAVMVSEQCHYSVKRAVCVMGLGEQAVIPVPALDNFKLDTDQLGMAYDNAVASGKKVVAVAASACSTATGSYDDLLKIGAFCKEKGLWFHVDGAHGASALLSGKYKHLLNGIEMADSLVWDTHKMMLMPALNTAVIFKNPHNSYEAFSQRASYLFENDAREEWYNMAHRTMECTKLMMGFTVYTCLSVYGTKFFGDYVDQVYDLTKQFAKVIGESPDFEVAIEPECNIICFRYTADGASDMNALQFDLRKKLLAEGSYYLVQTELYGKAYLRCTIINPLTTIEDLTELLARVRFFARKA
jgi:L-2,4-diaminobutyrate decarboxylase